MAFPPSEPPLVGAEGGDDAGDGAGDGAADGGGVGRGVCLFLLLGFDPEVDGLHCEYQAFKSTHVDPEAQHVGLDQPLPPHWPHTDAQDERRAEGLHCEYHSFTCVQADPALQQVLPCQLLPPHCCQRAEQGHRAPLVVSNSSDLTRRVAD